MKPSQFVFVVGLTALGAAGCTSLPIQRLPKAGASTPAFAEPKTGARLADALTLAGAILSNEAVATPSVRKAYYVGQLIDPAHPELMYRPGVVYREELPERWNRNPTATRGAMTGVIAAVPDAAVIPPSSPEQQQLIAQQQKVMQLLADANADLSRQVAELKCPEATPPEAIQTNEAQEIAQSPSAPAPAAVQPAKDEPAVVAPAARLHGVDLSHALVPNADGSIELSSEILDEVDRSEPNPFVKRYQTRTTFREIVITVTGTSPGPRPTASVNGRLLNLGDPWEGFTVVGITRDAVFLQREVFVLQIPLSRLHPTTVRLPQ